ncbi:hypothetical protein JRQ81_008227 [Phrynocephalus forsythii]|uniref:Uncharacterized protein n=1 Tax=Phrynocephalus forsythii TaxID=171643 RepID=A0A9Q1ATD1_9SAUR|nr:hypothetical protein JRQ81_008227 [Phrynocephalus forsythii]
MGAPASASRPFFARRRRRRRRAFRVPLQARLPPHPRAFSPPSSSELPGREAASASPPGAPPGEMDARETARAGGPVTSHLQPGQRATRTQLQFSLNAPASTEKPPARYADPRPIVIEKAEAGRGELPSGPPFWGRA